MHLADVHLGGSGPAFGERVRDHQRKLQEAFTRCIDVALRERVDAVCIAGDLFDARRPSERVLQFCVQQLRRLAEVAPPIECFLLPGTHDCLDAQSVYRRPEFRLPGLHVWAEPGPATFRTADGRLAFHGNPQEVGRSQYHPLAGLRPDPTAAANVAVAHGSVVLQGITEEDSAIIAPEEISSSGMDYVALGHWHDLSDYSYGGVKAAYSGSPEVVLVTQRGSGGVNLVTISESGTTLERIATGTLQCDALELSPETYPDEAAIAEALHLQAHPDLILEVKVSGMAPEGFTLDVARLQEELAPSFFRLRITDESVPPLSEAQKSGVARQLIAARAIAAFQKRIDQARQAQDPEAERIATRALQLSVALFAGKEVLG